jgi:tetratricopeptide (TPR) repeat protein
MIKPTDYEIELQRIDQAISELAGTALDLPMDAERATKFVYLLYQRGSLSGDLGELREAEAAVTAAINELGPAGDLCYLKANLDFKFHRLFGVREDLEMGRDLRHSSQGRALLRDLDFQEGRYDDAKKGFEELIQEDPTWDNFARLGYIEFKMGDAGEADRLYSEAEDELTAKEMRHYAWVELQRGVLDLRQGHYEKALAHYRVADRAYSGYWLVEEHMAELLGAQGKLDEAVALYERVVARLPRPEFQQALGELYISMGRPDKAETWNERALAEYLESAESGGVHYYHHLADFYADVREEGVEAVKWARKDIELRRNFSTLAALAWALYRAGKSIEARGIINEALSSGVRDAHLFYQAGAIHHAAGMDDEGDHYLRMAAEINSDYQSFHVHR